MTFNNIIEYAIYIMLGMLVARVILGFISFRLDQKLERLQAVRDKLDKVIHAVKVEKHHETYYWFDEDTDQFLAQGKTHDEIREHLKSRFTGHVFIVDNKEVWGGPELVAHAPGTINPDDVKI